MINCPLLLSGWPESGADLLAKCIWYGQDQSRVSAFISLQLIWESYSSTLSTVGLRLCRERTIKSYVLGLKVPLLYMMYNYDFLFTEVRAVRCNCTSSGCKWDLFHRASAGNKPYIQSTGKPAILALVGASFLRPPHPCSVWDLHAYKYILITPQATLIRNMCFIILAIVVFV